MVFTISQSHIYKRESSSITTYPHIINKLLSSFMYVYVKHVHIKVNNFLTFLIHGLTIEYCLVAMRKKILNWNILQSRNSARPLRISFPKYFIFEKCSTKKYPTRRLNAFGKLKGRRFPAYQLTSSYNP